MWPDHLPPEVAAWVRRTRETGRYDTLEPMWLHRSDRYAAKGWVLPDGRPVLIDCWHFEWILRQRELVERFGVDLQDIPPVEDPVRHAAVKAGFWRINYVIRSGELVFEGLASRLTREVTESLGLIVLESLEQVGQLHLCCFDDTVRSVTRQESMTLVSLGSDEKIAAVGRLLDLRFGE